MHTLETKPGRLATMALGLLLILPGTPAMAETVTLSGEVEAADYDEDGTVTRTAIYDGEWGLVLVLTGGKGAQLLNHVGEFVSAVGEIRELDDDDEYSYGIEVASYTIDATGAEDEFDDETEPGGRISR